MCTRGLPIAIWLLVLLGCSGGSAPAPALGLLMLQPPVGSTVDTGAQVALAFDREPDVASLTDEAFVVADELGPLPGSVAYDAQSRRWSWTPARALPRGAQLTARVAATLRGQDGEPFPGAEWTFRVRAGVPSAAVVLSSNSGSAGAARPFVGLRPDGHTEIALANASWTLDANGAVAPGLVPSGSVRGLHVDAAGKVVALTVSGVGTGVGIDVCRKSAGGPWANIEPVAFSGNNGVEDARLLGNDAGDLMVQLRLAVGFNVDDQLHWCSAGAPANWQLVLQRAATGNTPALPATLDGRGAVATMAIGLDGYVAVRRQDPVLGSNLVYWVSLTPYYSAIGGLGASADGELRAVWHAPGGLTMQRRSMIAGGFAEPTTLTVAVPPLGSHWLGAPSGAMVAWNGAHAFRSEAGADAWVDATLPGAPLAVAMSPRGEAVFLHFALPDAWSIVRWRAGEAIDAPVQIATAESAFDASRDGAFAIDASGLVAAVLSVDASGPLLAVRID